MTSSSSPAWNRGPYDRFPYRVRCHGRHVAGFSEVSGLRGPPDAVEYRDGGDNRTARHKLTPTGFTALTLKRGITCDVGFQAWLTQSLGFGKPPGGAVSAAACRPDLNIELYDASGHKVRAVKIIRCWVSAYQAAPHLDPSGNSVAFEQVTLENEGFEQEDGATRPG